jgi:hypothetical protein
LVGNGRKTFFWTDRWLGESPLAVRFERLFDICTSKEITVAEALPVSATSLQFRRSFGPLELDLWAALVQPWCRKPPVWNFPAPRTQCVGI